jgi:hypothetical protein
MTLQAEREQVLAFRLAGHNLAQYLPPDQLLRAAAACGVQNTPPGSAALALRARVHGLTPGAVERALAHDKTLLQTRSLRTAPYVFPTGDAALFTTALLPQDEAELRHFILGVGPALDKVGMTGVAVAERVALETLAVLDGRTLPFRQLSSELTGRVAFGLSPHQLEAWQSPSWYGPNQCLGEAIVHFALYVVALKGTLCFAPREGEEASFVRIDQWLGAPLPVTDAGQACAALLRRYLRCYGPSTPAHFAEWTGIAPAAASRAWDLIAPELVPVEVGGRRAWLREQDLSAFLSPSPATGVRLLPPSDPYLAQRDRHPLVPDKALHRRLWKPQGNPGAILAEGQIVGLWRPRKTGKRLVVTVEPFQALSTLTRGATAAEAAAMAVFRGCSEAETVFFE